MPTYCLQEGPPVLASSYYFPLMPLVLLVGTDAAFSWSPDFSSSLSINVLLSRCLLRLSYHIFLKERLCTVRKHSGSSLLMAPTLICRLLCSPQSPVSTAEHTTHKPAAGLGPRRWQTCPVARPAPLHWSCSTA